MIVFLLALPLLFVWASAVGGVSHKGVAFHIFDVKDSGRSYLFSRNHGCQRIPDNSTREFLLGTRTNGVVKASEVANGTLLHHCRVSATAIASTNIPENNPDNILLKHIRLFENLQGSPNMLHDLVEIPECFNPSIAHLRQMYLVACRGTNAPRFGWLDAHSLRLLDRRLYGVGPGLTSLPNIEGEDFRLLALDNNTVVLSFSYFVGHTLQMRFGELVIENDHLTFRNSLHLPAPPQEHQKNWCPFLYEGGLYFISQVEPMTTHRVILQNSNGTQATYVEEHRAAMANVSWMYGMIKGGTNARRITNSTYLGFFHSKQYLRPSSLITYVFGAYTFEAAPPFKLLSWSVTPIVHQSWYEGPWSHYKNYIDYIVFPMTYEFTRHDFDFRHCSSNACLNETELLLSVGIQDKTGYLAKLNLLQLLNTLQPVEHRVSWF